MKVQIYKKKEEKIVRLKLVAMCDDYVVLMAVNEDGKLAPSGSILRINSDGVRRYGSCDSGLPTDSDGKVVLNE